MAHLPFVDSGLSTDYLVNFSFVGQILVTFGLIFLF